MGHCVSIPGHERGASLSEHIPPELGVGINDSSVPNGSEEVKSDKMMSPSATSPVSTSRGYDAAASSNINKYMKAQKKSELKKKKLLLLGAGSSGKSTLFRQLKCIHGAGFHPSEFLESKSSIRSNCVLAILTLLKKSQELYEENKQQHQETFIDLEGEYKYIIPHIQIVLKCQAETFEEEDDLDWSHISDLADSIKMLWALPPIQATFAKRQHFSLIENVDFFLNKIEIIMDEHYEVSLEDHLKCRRRTTGLIAADYTINDVKFHIFDAGGQRNERKKWIQLFDGVTAVIFVAALNHYAAVLFEDELKNAMLESLQLFEEICNSKFFRRTEMILFLNKNDLFRERLRQQIPLSVFFNPQTYKPANRDHYDEYSGPQYVPNPDDPDADLDSLNDAAEHAAYFIQNQYEKRNHVAHKRVFVHITTATDKENIKTVFWDVQNIVINSNLRKGGLV